MEKKNKKTISDNDFAEKIEILSKENRILKDKLTQKEKDLKKEISDRDLWLNSLKINLQKENQKKNQETLFLMLNLTRQNFVKNFLEVLTDFTKILVLRDKYLHLFTKKEEFTHFWETLVTIHKLILQKLKDEGLREISVKVGDDFDAEYHEVDDFSEREKGSSCDKIKEVVKKGYYFDNKLFFNSNDELGDFDNEFFKNKEILKRAIVKVTYKKDDEVSDKNISITDQEKLNQKIEKKK